MAVVALVVAGGAAIGCGGASKHTSSTGTSMGSVTEMEPPVLPPSANAHSVANPQFLRATESALAGAADKRGFHDATAKCRLESANDNTALCKVEPPTRMENPAVPRWRSAPISTPARSPLAASAATAASGIAMSAAGSTVCPWCNTSFDEPEQVDGVAVCPHCHTELPPSPAGPRAPTAPDAVALYTDEPGRPYTAIDYVSARVRPRTEWGQPADTAQADRALRERASRLGANAVINVRYEHVAIGGGFEFLPDLRKRGV